MRCSFRRLLYILYLTVILSIIYTFHSSKRNVSKSPIDFLIVHYKNQTYRLFSSPFQYHSNGSYLNFAYFNVERRNRVRYIDYRYDIPVSRQWKSDGHLYPTQIAQFGLSHWSRLESNSQVKVSDIYEFDSFEPNKTNDSCSSWFELNNTIFLKNSFISFNISSNCSLHFKLLHNKIELIYSTEIEHELINFENIILPIYNSPRKVNRYILLDIEKSLKRPIIFQNDFIHVRICGEVDSYVKKLVIGNETLYNEQAFYSSANWLLKTQDNETGCWFIHIQRTFSDKYQSKMPWCSAMAQGQAASLLVRLYSITHNNEHLSSIHRAIKPLWATNLTRAYFQKRFLWLEEYPLKSSDTGLFVLNGCLYALIGLIDVYNIDPQKYLNDLINEIVQSLYHMLPYFIHPEISNWSLYDLGYLTIKSKINSASFSYHLVHIILLECLSQLFKKTNYSTFQLFDSYAKRFKSAIV